MGRRHYSSTVKTARTAERGREGKKGDEEELPGAHWWQRGAVDSGRRSSGGKWKGFVEVQGRIGFRAESE